MALTVTPITEKFGALLTGPISVANGTDANR
jgi:hypothetical protein